MTDLKQAIQKHVHHAWDRIPVPDAGFYEKDTLEHAWDELTEEAQEHLQDFVQRVIHRLTDEQHVVASSLWVGVALSKLRGVVGDDTAVWVSRAANLAAAGVDEATLGVLGRISSTQPVTPGDLNKLAAGSIPTPTDQPDEWEQCQFEDICKGDRVKRILVTESGQIHTTEGVANYYESSPDLQWWFHKRSTWNDTGGQDQFLARSDDPKDCEITVDLYRIPAPVVHPDPTEHPVIIVHESTVLPKGSEPQRVVYVRPYYRNDIWSGAPETITDWEPAKVVPANFVGDYPTRKLKYKGFPNE